MLFRPENARTFVEPDRPNAAPDRSGDTTGDEGEHRIIDALLAARPPRPAWVTVDAGHDCAVVHGDRALKVDTLVQDVHFDATWAPAEVGYKAVAAAISDLVAVGAEPEWLLLSVSTPDAAFGAALAPGVAEACRAFGVHLVGGDVTRSATRVVSASVGGRCVARPHRRDGEVDLASVRNGALALACSDAFFGPMNNLIAPGRAVNMGGGWETRRKRLPGHDWILVRLGAPGEVGLVEIDTNHFKGNYADRFALRGIHAPGARITDLVPVGSYGGGEAAWQTLIEETKLGASARHFFRDEVSLRGPFTHLRLDVFPDGGISRLRVWGKRT